MKKFKGFTLIELMIAISILAIILVVGVPSFQLTIQNNRLATNANGLISAMMIARNEAIKRGVNVRVMSNSNNQNWANGWTVITDDNNDNNFNIATATCLATTDCAVHVTTALNGSLTLRSVINSVAFFEFDPRGRLRIPPSTQDTLVMCDGRGFVAQARAIIVTNIGRVRVVSVTNADANANGVITVC